MKIKMERTMMNIVIGVIAGAALGFLYYRLAGCPSGACPITRHPVSSTLYGALMGLLIALSVKS